MEDSYVTSGATLKCSCGDKTAQLAVFPDRTVFLTEKPMANVSDHVSMYNIAPFGKCHTTSYPPTGSATAANHGSLTPMPCIPGTLSDWINGKNDYIIKGKSALLKSSYCKCRWGGIITITNDGQTDTGDPDLNRVALLDKEDILQKQEKKELSDNEKLDVKTVLDGIQTALDFAGFVPGIGAIPDLLNAAISASRGNMAEAGLSLVAAVPGIGDAAAGAKLASRGFKMAKTVKFGTVKVASQTMFKKEKRAIAKQFVSKDVTKDDLLSYKGVTKENVDSIYLQIKIERKKAAYMFYETNGASVRNIDSVEQLKHAKNEYFSHINGIDANYKVEFGTIKKGDILYQYNDGNIGNYVTRDPNATPSKLGIADTMYDNEKQMFVLKKHQQYEIIKGEYPCLNSTSKAINDTWSNVIKEGDKTVATKVVKTKGGGSQIYIPKTLDWKNNVKENQKFGTIHL